MKTIAIGCLLTLMSFSLQAQRMKTPNDIVTQLFIATDQRNWNQVKQLFAAKVLLDYSSMTGNPATELSPEQIVSAWKGVLPGFESTHHQLGNFVSNITQNKAIVFCYGTANHFLKNAQGSLWTVVGTYDFVLQKDSQGTWKIAAMKFNFKYQTGNTVLPQQAMQKLK